MKHEDLELLFQNAPWVRGVDGSFIGKGHFLSTLEGMGFEKGALRKLEKAQLLTKTTVSVNKSWRTAYVFKSTSKPPEA